MKLVNLTPHIVRVYLGTQDHPDPHATPSADWLILPVTGDVVHIEQSRDQRHSVCGVPMLRWVYGRVTGAPDPQPGVTYVVSYMVGRQLCRPDMVSPDTRHNPIFDENDKLYAVRRFQQHIQRHES